MLTRGYSFVVVNNALALDRAFALIPPALRPLSALSSNLSGNGPRGMERIDWDPRTRTCRSVWGNRDGVDPQRDPDDERRERARVRRRGAERLLGPRGHRLRHRRVEAVGPDDAAAGRELLLRGHDGRARRRRLDRRDVGNQRLPRPEPPRAPACLQGPRASREQGGPARPLPLAPDTAPGAGARHAHATSPAGCGARARSRAWRWRSPGGRREAAATSPPVAGWGGFAPAGRADTSAPAWSGGPWGGASRASSSAGGCACPPAATGSSPGRPTGPATSSVRR